VKLVDQSRYRSAQPSYQLDMANTNLRANEAAFGCASVSE